MRFTCKSYNIPEFYYRNTGEILTKFAIAHTLKLGYSYYLNNF